MLNKLAGVLILLLAMSSLSAQASNPILILRNQFGEQSTNQVMGGSNQIDINFIVDSTNGNGLGIRTLKGAGVANVFMHTSATPLGGNPNPAPGYVWVQLKKGYAGYVGGYSGFVSPVSGTPINVTTGVTAGLAYVITSVGTTTAAQWQALGLPAAITPNVGAAFIAPATVTTVGTGQIMVPAAAGSAASHIEVVGDPNQTSFPTNGSGAWVLCQVVAATSSSVTTFQATAPANNTVVALRFVMGLAPTYQ